MKKIELINPHTRKRFEFFNKMTNPHFNITANVNITPFLTYISEKKLPFTATLVFLLSKCANDIKEFRWRVRGNEIVEHEAVHPSFTVKTDYSETFSFCYVDYQNNKEAFIKDAVASMEKMKTEPSFEDEPGRDDYLFLSAIPWVSFTSFQHAMNLTPADSVPRIVWGKYFRQGEQTLMPLSIQVHHAIVDGEHVGQYFNHFEALANSIDNF